MVFWQKEKEGLSSSQKQNLCLDKEYDFPEIERESTKRRYIPHILYRGEEKELIKIDIQQGGGL
jgi:hypothetical protein